MGVFPHKHLCRDTHKSLFGVFLFLLPGPCQTSVLTELSLSNFPCVGAQSSMSQHKRRLDHNNGGRKCLHNLGTGYSSADQGEGYSFFFFFFFFFFSFFFFFAFFSFFRAALAAYGSSQARGHIRAAATATAMQDP